MKVDKELPANASAYQKSVSAAASAITAIEVKEGEFEPADKNETARKLPNPRLLKSCSIQSTSALKQNLGCITSQKAAGAIF